MKGEKEGRERKEGGTEGTVCLSSPRLLVFSSSRVGLVFPSDDTWFTAPSKSGLVGQITCKGVSSTRPRVITHKLSNVDEGFALGVRIERCEGKIDQWIAMVSFPNDPVLYIARLFAKEGIYIHSADTATFSVFNEDAPGIIPNYRTLHHAGGSERIGGESKEPTEGAPDSKNQLSESLDDVLLNYIIKGK